MEWWGCVKWQQKWPLQWIPYHLTLYATGRPVLDDFIFQIVMKIGQKDAYVDSKKQFWAFPDKINFKRFMASDIFGKSSEMAMCRRC